MNDSFQNVDWARVAMNTASVMLAIYYGRWSQRRDDRRKARRAQERRLAEVLAQQTLRGRNRGA